MRHENFQWDVVKASKNLARHKVDFEEAAAVLADPFADQFHVEEFDEDHSTANEDRWITTGSYPFDRRRVFVIIWTVRREDEDKKTRIISARSVTRQERLNYEDQTRDR